jgi:hypothetical protein
MLGDGNSRVWNLDGTEHAQVQGYSPSFSPDGQYVLTDLGDGHLKGVWNLDGTEHTQVQGGSPRFSPDGQYVLTDLGSTSAVWNLNGAQIAEIQGYLASFSPDGQYVLTALGDGTSRVWQIDSLTGLLERGCNQLQAYLMSHPNSLQDLKVCHTPSRLAAAAPTLVREGEAQARRGNVEEAIASFRLALEWNPNLNIDPQEKATALSLVEEAESLATEGNVEGRSLNFKRHYSATPASTFPPEKMRCDWQAQV